MKLTLSSRDAYEKLLVSLESQAEKKAIHAQENFFFDGAHQELSREKVIVRIRFHHYPDRCVLAIKGQAVIVNGVSCCSEEEEEIDATLGRSIVSEPSKLLSSSIALAKKVESVYGCSELVRVGRFKNKRSVFAWQCLTLEVDETRFDFGTAYELECETATPEVTRQRLETFLKEHNISFKYSAISKFKRMLKGTFDD